MARSSSRISCTVVLFGPLSASTIAWLALVRVGIRPRWDMPSMTASSALRRTPRGFRYLYETLMLSPFPILLSSPEYCPPLKVYRCPADNAGKIGRAHVCTPVTNAHLVCRLLLEKKKLIHRTHK